MNEENHLKINEVDQQFSNVLLELNFAGEQHRSRIGGLVDDVINEIRADNDSPKKTIRTASESRRMLRWLSGLAAAALVMVGIGFLLLGPTKDAQAMVMDVLERTLAGGPRKYDATFQFSGPVLGLFERQGSYYLDGRNKFRIEVPSPLGIESRVWTIGSDGEKPWAIFPAGRTWQGTGEKLDEWWQSRGQDEIPVLHVEAVIQTLGESYKLTTSTNELGLLVISGTETEKTPPRWSEKIVMVIDQESGFAQRIEMTWTSGRLRKINLKWDQGAEVPPNLFEFNPR